MLNQIPRNRLILYIMLLGLLPILLVGMHFWSQKSEFDRLQANLDSIRNKTLIKLQKQAVNQAAHDQYKNADHFYIDKQLETLQFLEDEISNLKKLTANRNFVGDEALTKRLEKLQGKENRLLFSGGQVTPYQTFQESTLSLTSPVEVNPENIQEILAKIEGVKIGSFAPGHKRPQMILVDFKIDRKEVANNNEVYLLNIKLLKREYL